MSRLAAMHRSATLSHCRRYRYRLSRTWDLGLPAVLFICLNPSTADATVDDPTVRRCIGFAHAWGFGRLDLANLFALRTPHPRDLRADSDPLGPDNPRHLAAMIRRADLIVAAWGNLPTLQHPATCPAAALLARLPAPHHLGLTRLGHPRHPLYLKATTRPMRWATI